MKRLLILCVLFGFAHAIAKLECLQNAELVLAKCVSGLDGFSDKSCKNGDLKQCASALAKQACKNPEKVKDSIRCLFKDFVNPCVKELEDSTLKGSMFDYASVHTWRELLITEFRERFVPRKAAVLNLVSYLCQQTELQSKECDFEVLFPTISMCVERKMRGDKFHPLIACKLLRDIGPECLTEHASKCPSGVVKLWQYTFKTVLPTGCTNHYEFNWTPLPAEAKAIRVEHEGVINLIMDTDVWRQARSKFAICGIQAPSGIQDCKPQDPDYVKCVTKTFCGPQLDEFTDFLACMLEVFKDVVLKLTRHLFKKATSDVSRRMVSHTYTDTDSFYDALEYYCNHNDERDTDCVRRSSPAAKECIKDKIMSPVAKLVLTLFSEGTLEDWVHNIQQVFCTLYKSTMDCWDRVLSSACPGARELTTEFLNRLTPEPCIIADASRNKTPRQKDEL